MTESWDPVGDFARGEVARNSAVLAEACRRALYGALPARGWAEPAATESGEAPGRVREEVQGVKRLTVNVYGGLLFSSLSGPARLTALRPFLSYLGVFGALLPDTPSLLRSLHPAAASLFARFGRMSEAAALSDSRGYITREGAAAIRWEGGHAIAEIGALVATAETAAGMRLVAP